MYRDIFADISVETFHAHMFIHPLNSCKDRNRVKAVNNFP